MVGAKQASATEAKRAPKRKKGKGVIEIEFTYCVTQEIHGPQVQPARRISRFLPGMTRAGSEGIISAIGHPCVGANVSTFGDL